MKPVRSEYVQSAADMSQWEREIDQLVYELYGLSEDEIKIAEGHPQEHGDTPPENGAGR